MLLKQHPRYHDVFLTETGLVFRRIATSLSSNGYHTVKLPLGSTSVQTVRRHVLVAETFVGPKPHPSAVVRHIDGNPGNDSPSNLEWGTQRDNCADTVLHGRSPRGERHGQVRITLGQAQEIYDRRVLGESGKALADEFGITQAAVCDLYKGRTWPEVRRARKPQRTRTRSQPLQPAVGLGTD